MKSILADWGTDARNQIVRLDRGRLAEDSPVADVAALARAAAEAAGTVGLVLHFPPGLGDARAGTINGHRLITEYRKAERAFTVYFHWESALLNALDPALAEIAAQPLTRVLWKRAVRVLSRKAAQGPAAGEPGRLPAVDTSELERSIDAAIANRDALRQLTIDAEPLASGVRPLTKLERLALETELEPDSELGRLAEAARGDPRTAIQSGAGAVVDIANAVLDRYTNGRAHGFHPTIIEEILRAVHFAGDRGLTWTSEAAFARRAFAPDAGERSADAFIAALAEGLAARAGPHRLTVVAHGPGATLAFEFLDRALDALPDRTGCRAVFLAPTTPFARVAATIERHGGRFDATHLLGLKDSIDFADAHFESLYPLSLPYFVSGVLEREADTPLLGMHRFYRRDRYRADGFPEVEYVRRYLLEHGSITWSGGDTGSYDLETAARGFRALDRDPATLSSLRRVIVGGL